ncbi:s-adenosyl-l-methionine-dependent methyltransferase [Lucifera butyrica]|uniref:S-adenosyl-l-methionine-dependent methyltransferase n=1 Tax=Lucifera butyrica TaxID=1351585 RepID=A0A498RBC6_9FIRM|nr:methyltransferase domain-containing protein [Lucifera butyrica]VBB08250.1 s-adenosyl-l-methionine-dependent methyltransferase [Lucifera butyrica]
MAHQFDISQKSKLDSPARQKMLPPQLTLQKLGLVPGDIVVDIGCGTGYFALPAAGIVGSDGQVLALDLSAEMLLEVERRASAADLTNIKTVKVQKNRLFLPDNTATLALVAFVLHETEHPGIFFAGSPADFETGGTNRCFGMGEKGIFYGASPNGAVGSEGNREFFNPSRI